MPLHLAVELINESEKTSIKPAQIEYTTLRVA